MTTPDEPVVFVPKTEGNLSPQPSENSGVTPAPGPAGNDAPPAQISRNRLIALSLLYRYLAWLFYIGVATLALMVALLFYHSITVLQPF